MITNIIARHRDGNLEDSVPNPSLTEVCQLVGKAACAVTPAVQRKAFRATGVTLAIDGSEDSQLTKPLRDLLEKHNQTPVVSAANLHRFMAPAAPDKKTSMTKIFEILYADAEASKSSEFRHDPPALSKKLKKDQK